MRKILGLLMVLAISMGFATPAEAAKKLCVTHSDTDISRYVKSVENNLGKKYQLKVTVKHVWKACSNGDRTWAVPKKTWVRAEGINGKYIGHLNYVEVNTYFSDSAGRNFNPGAHRLYFNNLKWDEVSDSYYKPGKLYQSTSGKSPRARTTIEVVQPLSRNEHGSATSWMDFIRTHPLDRSAA